MTKNNSNNGNGHRSGYANRLSLHFKPVGAVFDDNPDPLLQSIESRIEKIFGRSYIPHLEVHTHSSDPVEIDRWIRGADFALIDNNIDGRFKGFSSGLEIGKRIIRERDDLPLILYTAYPDDLEKSAQQHEFREFTQNPNVHYYPKGDLTPRKKLDELCRTIAFGIESTLASGSDSEEAAELQGLLETKVESVRSVRCRIIDFDRRKTNQLLRIISEPGMDEFEIPTRSLRFPRSRRRSRDVILKVVEFSGGQVLSYVVNAPLRKADLADDVIKFLEDSE